MRKRRENEKNAVTLSGETLLLLSDEKPICYRAIINYVPQRMVEGAQGLVCVCVCVCVIQK